MDKRYDVAIIGSGPAGYSAALRLGMNNRSVCVIDFSQALLGGVCLNEGCIPVKSMLNTAKVYRQARQSEDRGVTADVKDVDIKKAADFASSASSRLRKGIKGLLDKYGVVFTEGRAELDGSSKLRISKDNGDIDGIEAESIIIATGSRPKGISGIEADGHLIMTSRDALRCNEVPRRLLVIGAGAIGIEFSSIFSAFGSEVTLVEAMPRLLPSVEEELSSALGRIFKKRGINILTDAGVSVLHKGKQSVEAELKTCDSVKRQSFDAVLIAAGRIPNTDGLGLDRLGIKMTDGFIDVDEGMRTNIYNIFAAGDVLKTPMYAHTAYREAYIASDSILGNVTKMACYKNTPLVVFSEPQIASAGLNESEARALYGDVVVSRAFYKANGLAVATNHEDGFIKVVFDKKERLLYGVHIIGEQATEMIHEYILAMNAGLKVDAIADVIHAHPTYSEMASALFSVD
ncbi:MAG: dihydrolipoyl dehydrogenase [Candidatus Omnitrophica bacterium]|nr:dihydrolipoyl dehydrogenase [Candidatus Omnitrophota bacterium]